MVIDSATTSTDETDRTNENIAEFENYSEWRLFPRGIPSRYHYVTVNEGFRNRDFQTSQGGSVIDPEILGKLCYEGSSISNQADPGVIPSLFFAFFVLG
jgi:hypothetical protein